MDETWITRASDRIPSESYFLCGSGSFKKDRRNPWQWFWFPRKAHILRYPFPRKIKIWSFYGVSTETKLLRLVVLLHMNMGVVIR